MESLKNNNHSSHNQVSNWTKNDNLLYSDITCCNAGLHYSMCLAWISCITSSSWTLRCTVHYLYWQVYSPPTNICTGQNTTIQQGITGWYYITTAAMQYSTMPVRPCSCRVYKQEEPQTPPPVFYLQPYWKLELEEPNLNRIWGTQCCENNKMMPRLPRSTSSDRRKGSMHLEQVNFSGTWVDPSPTYSLILYF